MLFNKFRFLFSKTPTYFIFWVTQNCNFKCQHCFNYIENTKKNFDLTLEEVRRISSNLGHVKYITLAGGEPMLRDDLADIIGIFYQQNDLHMLNLVTNGWFTDKTVTLAKTVLDSCPNLHMSVAVSLDGPKEIHDKIRQKEGSFERGITTLEALKQLGASKEGRRLSVMANGTYSAANAHEMQNFTDYFAEKVKVPLYMTYVRGEDIQDNSLLLVSIDYFRRLSQHVSEHCNKQLSRNYPFRNLRLAVDDTVQNIIYDSAKHNKMTVPCKAGKRGFVLTANGEILLCEVLNIRLGNVRDHEYDPMRVLQLPQSQKEMDNIVTNQCHCTWECFQTLNVIYSPSLYPKVIKKALRQTLFG